MDRINSRIAQVYGYAVCFITVIMILISIKSVVDAVIDLSDPIRADAGGYGRSGRSLSSFELYKLDSRREPRPPVPVGVAPAKTPTDSLSDADLRRLYEAERDQAVGNVKFRAKRTLLGSGALITIALFLFILHWRWLRDRETVPVASTA
ncbi:MAG TPA: hypothetical protein VJ840_07260 [Gemmatimonadaceae bacterium]|nr:hypothetical protein [Gemmatimonadaceae bacterium]